MALTYSNPMPIGAYAPPFTLPDTVSGNQYSLHQLTGQKATVIMFLCNHCPYVVYVNSLLVAIANECIPQGVSFIAISSNDAQAYPDDAPDKMTIHAQQNNYPFPYLYDETQQVARSYDAACTPDIYVFDSQLCLTYHGQIDDARPKNDKPLDGHSLREAIRATIHNQPTSPLQKPSSGCNIKWKSA